MILRRDQTNIYAAYNAIFDEALTHPDLEAVHQQIDPPRAAMQRADDVGEMDQILDRLRRVGRRRHELDVANRVLAAPQRTGPTTVPRTPPSTTPAPSPSASPAAPQGPPPQAQAVPDAVRINANENPLGPCKEAREAVHRMVDFGGRYRYSEGDKVKETTRAFEEIKVTLQRLYEHWEEAVELN